MIMTILQAGPLTTVQDTGRFGFMEYGIGSSGVMDTLAYSQANELVGNPPGEAVLEMTLMGAEIMFDEEALIAYTGADMQVVLDDGSPIERGRAYQLAKGQRIRFGIARSGVRAYLAVAGTIDVPVVMGSRSTNLKCGIGGYHGRKLQNGDVLPVSIRKDSELQIRKLLCRQIKQPDYEKEKRIRVVLGPQEDMFREEGIRTFFQEAYTVSTESDRMGIRLLGEAVLAKAKTDIISDGIVFGSIQITSAGLPIIMMADHQTTGGYAKIATVIKEDLPVLAQARPGDLIQFEKVEIRSLQKKHFRIFRGFWQRKCPAGQQRR